tara:strand:+ start:763 stop:1206 length:444 start_codon:yes stop_codon:yes gene_type:complete
MAKRKTQRRRRRTSNNINLLNIAQGVVAGTVITQGMFGLNPMQFLRGDMGVVGYTTASVSGKTGGRPIQGYTGIASGTNRISLMEIFGKGPQPELVGSAILENVQNNWLNMTLGLTATRIGFKIGKKFARPALTPMRRLLKGTGVTV